MLGQAAIGFAMFLLAYLAFTFLITLALSFFLLYKRTDYHFLLQFLLAVGIAILTTIAGLLLIVWLTKDIVFM